MGQMGTDLTSHGNDPLTDLTAILDQDMAMVARYEAVSEQQGDLGGNGPRRQRRLPRRAGRRQPARGTDDQVRRCRQAARAARGTGPRGGVRQGRPSSALR